MRKGTNGGVPIDGLLAAAAAGFLIGLAFVLIGFVTTQCAPDVFWNQLLAIPLATAAGLCGSLIDSFLGATVQYSGFYSVSKKVLQPNYMKILPLSLHILVSSSFESLFFAMSCLFCLGGGSRWSNINL